MKVSLKTYMEMEYSINFLSIGDADAIVIMYKENDADTQHIALIDAGNVGDSDRIKQFIKNKYNTCHIDLAVCTHPDADHKGGFFDLLTDDEITIDEFWLKNPLNALNESDYEGLDEEELEELIIVSKRIFAHPEDESVNLIDLANEKCNNCYDVGVGAMADTMPIKVLGPFDKLYRQAAIGMLEEYQELDTKPDISPYMELAETDEDSARSMINNSNKDTYTNTSSIVLLFRPRTNSKYLLCGDASASSLADIITTTDEDLSNCILKVPHHGSIYNLTTDIIDSLAPQKSIICADGNSKHPDPHLVYYLRKYCNVYSTHHNTDYGITNRITGNKVQPFRQKF